MHNLSHYKDIFDVNHFADEGNLSGSDLISQAVLSGRWLPVVQRRRYGCSSSCGGRFEIGWKQGSIPQEEIKRMMGIPDI